MTNPPSVRGVPAAEATETPRRPCFLDRCSALPTPARRWAFWLYAAALFTATHWPRLTLPHTIIERPDLLVHATAFGLWALLLSASGHLGTAFARTTTLRVLPIGLAYAALDEGLQAIPWIHRTAALDDWGADAVGVVLATLLAVVVASRPRNVRR